MVVLGANIRKNYFLGLSSLRKSWYLLLAHYK
jgi:hypothetical protein